MGLEMEAEKVPNGLGNNGESLRGPLFLNLQEEPLFRELTNDHPSVKRYKTEQFEWKHYFHKYRPNVSDYSEIGSINFPSGLVLLVQLVDVTGKSSKYYQVFSSKGFNELTKEARSYDHTGFGTESIGRVYVMDASITEKDRRFFSIEEKIAWYKENYDIVIATGSSIKVTYYNGKIDRGIVDKDLNRFTTQGNYPVSPLLHNKQFIKNIEME